MANVVVTRSGQASAPQSLQVGPFSPGIFAVNNIAIAINPDGTVAAAAGAIPGLNTRPAKIGNPVGLETLCTGLGAGDPPCNTDDHVTSCQLHNATPVPT